MTERCPACGRFISPATEQAHREHIAELDERDRDETIRQAWRHR